MDQEALEQRTLIVNGAQVVAYVCAVCSAAIYPRHAYLSHQNNHDRLRILKARAGQVRTCQRCRKEHILADTNPLNPLNQCPYCRAERVRNAAKRKIITKKSKQGSATGIEYKQGINNAPNRGGRA